MIQYWWTMGFILNQNTDKNRKHYPYFVEKERNPSPFAPEHPKYLREHTHDKKIFLRLNPLKFHKKSPVRRYDRRPRDDSR